MLLFLEQVRYSASEAALCWGGRCRDAGTKRTMRFFEVIHSPGFLRLSHLFLLGTLEWHSRSVLMSAWAVDTPDPWSQATMISGKGTQRWYQGTDVFLHDFLLPLSSS